MKILFAQNNTEDMKQIENLLIAEGHELILVIDGGEVAVTMQEDPDMVMMDVNLPGISGFECCRLIKHDEKTRHKPVVLLMPTHDATAWARFAECGADDFIEQPVHPHVVKAKIKLLSHIQELYQRLDASHRHAEQEIRLAKHMFDTITKRQPKEIDFLHFWSLSAGHFCGELVIFEHTPEGHLHLFMGDFTGHGLSAAMGALPISDIFFSMTRKGCSIAQIVEEMNLKLFEILPTGKFCSATLLRLEADYSRIDIWNGGFPPVLLVDSHYKITAHCESFHLPLGIVDPADFSCQTKQFELHGKNSVVLYSDGLIEAHNSFGECFGEERVVQVIGRKVKDGSIFNRIKGNVLSFLEGLEPHDDVSLAVIHIN